MLVLGSGKKCLKIRTFFPHLGTPKGVLTLAWQFLRFLRVMSFVFFAKSLSMSVSV